MIPVNPTKVFISYAHDNERHKQLVLDLANRLVNEGVDCWLDSYAGWPERGWPAWMEEKIRLSDYVLVVASEKYQTRFENREVAGVGLGAKFESILILQDLYEGDFINKKFIPIVVDSADVVKIIKPLRPFTRYNVASSEEYDLLYALLTNQSKTIRPELGQVRKLFEDKEAALSPESANELTVEPTKIPEIPELTNSMTPAIKIIQAFFMLNATKRFSIADKLGLLEVGESFEDENRDEISSKILVRAKEQHKLAQLWEMLFDENIDPNPFK